MKLKKSSLFSRKPITTRKLKNLVKKALKDKPECKPAKGYLYLKDIPVGSLFQISTGTKGILLEVETNAKVHITDVPNIADEDRKYHLGKKLISAHTEAKII